MKGKELAGYLKVFAYLELFFGIVGSIIIAYQQGTEVETSYSSLYGYRYETVRNVPLTLGIFVGLLFSVIVLFVLILSVETILENQIYFAESLDKITHNFQDLAEGTISSSMNKTEINEIEDIPVDNLPDI